MPFTNKTVVITGAGAGVGRGLAAGFCKDGANVVGFGRTQQTLEETAERFGQGRMHCVTGNVGNAADVDRLFKEVLARFGKIDVLINNAAVYPRELFLQAPAEHLAQVLDVNVTGMAHCCRAALPSMLQNGHGRILNVGSFAWKGPIPTALAYSVSKAAVHALTKAIAAEIDRGRFPDVLINEFMPGIVKTSMSAEGMDPMEVYPHARSVASLPAGGPHGQVFMQSDQYDEYPSFSTRIKRKLGLS